MACKVTMIFSVTTTAVNPTDASAHSGGWSESFWTPANSYVALADLNNLMDNRAPLLPKGASIVGLRQGLYTIDGNKLLPQGTSGFKVNKPGNSSYTINLPQDSLEMSGTSQTSINSNRFRLGCLPDEMVKSGEYAPTSTYKGYITTYTGILAGGANAWSFIGRILSLASVRILSITPGVGGAASVLVSGIVGAVVGVDYVRFHRVYNDNGVSVRGAFRTTAFNGTDTYTIAGYTGGGLTHASGTMRVDKINTFQFAQVLPSRAVVKKIGRPSSSYRGRQSNRR